MGALFDKGPPPIRSSATPARPGSGPEGQTCSDCANYRRVEYHNKTYRKCELMRSLWSHCSASDIKASLPACKEFTAGVGLVIPEWGEPRPIR